MCLVHALIDVKYWMLVFNQKGDAFRDPTISQYNTYIIIKCFT